MKLSRHQFLHLAACAAALPAVSRFAMAQAYPSRPARIIVAAAAGGSADITARLIGQWLTERLGQSFLVENRSGGNSNIGTEAVVRAPADGYTLLLATSTNAINASRRHLMSSGTCHSGARAKHSVRADSTRSTSSCRSRCDLLKWDRRALGGPSRPVPPRSAWVPSCCRQRQRSKRTPTANARRS